MFVYYEMLPNGTVVHRLTAAWRPSLNKEACELEGLSGSDLPLHIQSLKLKKNHHAINLLVSESLCSKHHEMLQCVNNKCNATELL